MKFLFPFQFLLIWLCLFDKSFGVTPQRRKSFCGYACEYVCNKACQSCDEKCNKVCESICGRKKREVSTFDVYIIRITALFVHLFSFYLPD